MEMRMSSPRNVHLQTQRQQQEVNILRSSIAMVGLLHREAGSALQAGISGHQPEGGAVLLSQENAESMGYTEKPCLETKVTISVSQSVGTS